jgi:hypothetical protein
MKRSFVCLFVIVLFVLTVHMPIRRTFRNISPVPFAAWTEKFSHSRVLIGDDGATFGACSIHCAAVGR